MKVKEESQKPGLKLSIQKTKIMASCPITSQQIVGETMKIVTDFIFLHSKITVAGDCSHKRCLLLGRKVMTNLDSILKRRDVILSTKVDVIKAIPLDCEKIQPVNSKGNQPWIFIGRTDAEAETPTLWPLDVKNWLILKEPDAGKDWRWEENGMTEDEMVGWHHQLNGYEFEQAPRDGEGQGSLVWYHPWGNKESDMTEQLNSNNKLCPVCL